MKKVKIFSPRNIGMALRFKRLSKNGKMIVVPMDHGGSVGSVPGLEEMDKTVRKIIRANITAVLLHKGIVADCFDPNSEDDKGLFIHLSGCGLASGNSKTLICDVEEAIALGADGVSVHINLGNEDELNMLSDFQKVSKECRKWGVPLMVMAYWRGQETDRLEQELMAKKISKKDYLIEKTKRIGQCARLFYEYGATIIKIPYTGTVASFKEAIRGIRVPVLIAGGPAMDSDKEVLQTVKGAMQAGASGTSIGRNIFQHEFPGEMCAAIAAIVYEGASVSEALKLLEDKK